MKNKQSPQYLEYYQELNLNGMSESDESKRVSVQISSLSTQLIESIDKQSQLEEKLNQARRTIQIQKTSIEKVDELNQESESLRKVIDEKDANIKELTEQIESEKVLRLNAENSVDELNKEIEDLTASLFDEANKMVATARREAHATEIKNSRLIEQLREKDTILETLNLQLKNLKKVLQNLEDETPTQSINKRNSVPVNDNATSSSVSLRKHSSDSSSHLQGYASEPIYSPNVSSIRYDLGLYKEFLKFVAVLPHCQSIRESTSESKLLKRIVNDEIQPVLKLENASGLGWIVKRTLMSQMMDGLVTVEPLSGINENYQLGYASTQLRTTTNSPHNGTPIKDSHLFNFPVDSPPIAVYEKCSFCGESRRDVIEHARMHVLKTLARMEDGSLVVTNSFPLCIYCLLKIRQTCEIFAFLRSLKIGAWNLEKITLASISNGESDKSSIIPKSLQAVTNNEIKSPVKSDNSDVKTELKSPPLLQPAIGQAIPTSNIQRAWLQLCKLRSTLHWTHIGIWSINDSIGSKIGPVNPDDSNSDICSMKSDEIYDLKNVMSEDSFISKKENEESNENEIYDFENADNSITVTQMTNQVVGQNDPEKREAETEALSDHKDGHSAEKETEQNASVAAAKPSMNSGNNDGLPAASDSLENSLENKKEDDKRTIDRQITPKSNSVPEKVLSVRGSHTSKSSINEGSHSSFSNSSNKEDEFDDAREEPSGAH